MSKIYDKYNHVSPKRAERLLKMPASQLVLESIQEELEHIEKEIRYLQRSLNEALSGKLLVSGTNSQPKYYLEKEGVRQYISRAETDLAASYAQQEYTVELLRVLESRREVLHGVLHQLKQLDPQQVFQCLSEKRKLLVLPEYLSDEEYLRFWSSLQYSGKKFRQEDKEFYTARGERVRSKSESDIADRCYYRGVFYLYEYPWTLPSAGVWFPDFTVLNVRTRKVYLWEHLGREDDPNYAIRSMRKLRLYQENGFWPGENLILTHETADRPLNIHDIDAVIEHYLI